MRCAPDVLVHKLMEKEKKVCFALMRVHGCNMEKGKKACYETVSA